MKRSIAAAASFGITLATASVAFAHVPFVSAQDGQRTVRPPLQIAIGNDSYIAGEAVNLTETVNGNVNAAGGKVNVSAAIGGDLQAAGGEVTVSGGIRDNARIAGGNVSVGGRVNGTLTVIGGQVHIEKTAVIGGGLLVTGGTVVIDGTVNGALKAYGGEIMMNGKANGITEIRGGTVTVNGLVASNATVAGESLTVGETASFGGNLDYWSGQGQRDFSGRVKGTATFRDDLRHESKQPGRGAAAEALAGITLFSLFSAAFVIGLMMFFTHTYFSEAAKILQKKPWISLLTGFLFIILTPILALVLMLTFIGIPLAIAVVLMYAVSLYFSTALTSVVFARWIEHYNKKKWRPVTLFFLSLGVFIVLKLLWLVPLLGWLAAMVAVMMGLGSALLMKHQIYMKHR